MYQRHESWLTTAYRHIVSPPPRNSDADLIFETTVRGLVREVERKAQAVAISCAIANAVATGTPVAATELHRYFPERAKVFPAVLLGSSPLYLDRDSTAAFSALHDLAGLASELSLRHAKIAGGGGPSCVARSGIADAWRITATRAAEAIRQAELLLINTGATYRMADTESLVTRLEAVAAGATTGVGADGRVTTTPLREDRRDVRYLKAIPSTARTDTFETPVMVRDISRGGCGFDTTRRIPVDTPVTIILQNGAQFSGTIIWAIGMSAGLAFDSRISESEAMFAGEYGRQI